MTYHDRQEQRAAFALGIMMIAWTGMVLAFLAWIAWSAL